MEQVLVFLILALGVYAIYKWLNKKDQNEDGRVDWQDGVEAVKAAAEDVREAAVKVADVNEDGKVNLADAVEVVATVKKGRKGRKKKKG